MPTSYTDQFYIVDIAGANNGDTLEVYNLTFVDENDDGNLGIGDTFDGLTVDYIYRTESITVTVDGSEITYTGATIILSDGTFLFTPLDPSPNKILYDGFYAGGTTTDTLVDSIPIANMEPVCFTVGTLIQTPTGSVPVETLRIGDLVITADHGPVPLRSVCMRTYSAAALTSHNNALPIRISKGALGNGLPNRDLLVSPQHRVLLHSRIIKRMYGVPEILAPAVQLTRMKGIERVTSSSVTYVHLVFSAHQVIFAEGAPAESLLLGPQIHENLSQNDIQRLMDDLGPNAPHPTTPARPLVKGPKLNTCLARHIKNNVDLLSKSPPTNSAFRAA